MAKPSRPEFPLPALITTTDALDAFCQRMHGETFITVDTEFMRERTYWPELCLMQIAGRAEVAVIDAEAEGLDLASLGSLFADETVTKVFHAARQDIEIFVLRFGDVPRPMFDTQVAAMVAGFGDQVGYDALVSNLTGGSIDKAHRFSDWSARPLSDAQIAYAAADVTHLREVYYAPQQPPGAGKSPELGRGGNGDPQQPRHLPRRSGNRVGKAAPPHDQPPAAICPEGGRSLAGEGGTAGQHSAPAA